MSGAKTGSNPFRPGAGVAPPLLAGRDRELAAVERRLATLADGRAPAQGLLLFGPRGNGKTVLLGEISRRAEERGLRAVSIPASAFQDVERLEQRLKRLSRRRWPRITGLSLGPLTAVLRAGASAEGAFELLLRWLRKEKQPVVILVDEVQTIGISAGRAFLDAVQAGLDEALGFLLVVAGTPDAPRRLRQVRTNTERAFRRLRISRLNRPETLAALTEPARKAGRPMDEDAAALLARESQDYPYFIQLLGSSLWAAAGSDVRGAIGRSAAAAATGVAQPRIRAFYAERFAEARSCGVDDLLAPLADAMRRGKGTLFDDDIRALVQGAGSKGTPSDAWTTRLDALTDLGVLWEITDGEWEMGIPSFADYVLDRASKSRRPAPAGPSTTS